MNRKTSARASRRTFNPRVMRAEMVRRGEPRRQCDTPLDPAWNLPNVRQIVIATGAENLAKVTFTPNIQRHVVCREAEAAGASVREVLDNLFADNPVARRYVLDDQLALRRHMTIFIDGDMIRDRVRLSDPVSDNSQIHVFQALSGG